MVSIKVVIWFNFHTISKEKFIGKILCIHSRISNSRKNTYHWILNYLKNVCIVDKYEFNFQNSIFTGHCADFNVYIFVQNSAAPQL